MAAQLFRDLSLGHSKRRDSTPPSLKIMPPPPTADDLPSPLGQLSTKLSDEYLTLTAYEIFVAACRTSSGKPLSSSIANSSSNNNNTHSDSPSHNSPLGIQRSLTSTAASKVKKAFGLKSPGSGSKKSPGSGSGSASGSGQGKLKRPLTVGELMRNQMRVSEAMDSRVRRALLRISAGQVTFFLLFQCMYSVVFDPDFVAAF